MEQNAFELIAGRIDEELSANGFTMVQSGKVDSNKPAVFVSDTVAYALIYDKKQKRFELRQTAVEDGTPGDNWKNISVWIFDGETDTLREADSIANDFLETLTSSSRKKQAMAAKAKKKEKSDEKNVDPFFFINRFVTMFPEIKYDVQADKTEYGNVLPVNFIAEVVTPKIHQLFMEDGDPQKADKLFDLLNTAYKNGDLDVKGIITMVILNSFENEREIAMAEETLSKELLDSWKHARKLKNRKIKPEKVKKMQKLMAENSTDSLRKK